MNEFFENDDSAVIAPNYTTPTRLSISRQTRKRKQHRGIFLPTVDTKEAFAEASSRYTFIQNYDYS